MVKPKQKEVPHRNKSPDGWWIYGELEQWVSNRQKKLAPHSRCPVWENLRLISAKTREEAYKKAMKRGKKEHPSFTADGEWRFAGISTLLPIYEGLEDGAEILWSDRGTLTQAQIEALVKSPEELPVFKDQEDGGDSGDTICSSRAREKSQSN